MTPPRRQLAGVGAVAAALDAGEPVRLLLVAKAPPHPAAGALVDRAKALGIPVRVASERALSRLSETSPPAEILALVGGPPDADRETVLASGGLLWLLVGLAYPGKQGVAVPPPRGAGA